MMSKEEQMRNLLRNWLGWFEVYGSLIGPVAGLEDLLERTVALANTEVMSPSDVFIMPPDIKPHLPEGTWVKWEED